MKNSTLVLSAFVLGAGIGAAVGFLMAPAAGSETRKKLAEGAGSLIGPLKKQILDGIEGVINPVTREHANQQEEYNDMLGI